MMLRYYPKVFSVFGQHEKTFVILDNASTHKKYKENLEEFNKDDIADWLTDKMQDEECPQEHRTIIQNYIQYYNNHSETITRKDIMGFIRENKLRTVELIELASWYGPGLLYLPPYWPELNAIEKLWARLKNDYRKTDPHKDWRVRLEEAYSKITPDFILKIISDTIRFARKKHEQFEANAAEVQPHEVAIGESDGDGDDDFAEESSEGDEESSSDEE